jgi:hypothetical protein
MFLLVFGIIIFSIGRSMMIYFKNNKQPIIPVEAKIVAKRYNVRHHHRSNTHHHSSSTIYYVTFEFTNGERIELNVPSYEFGMLAEGDQGILNFQGTRYISFTRN